MPEVSTFILYVFIFLSVYVQVFFLVTFLEKREKIFSHSARTKKYPSVTVIVPCWNEEKSILGTIKSLLNLDYPKNKLKIFVVDDGSTDGTWEIVKGFENNFQVRIFRKENGGKYTALNLGLKEVETEFVACLDADSFVEPEALKKIFSYFEDEKTMAVIPAAIVYAPRTVIQNAQIVEYNMSVFFKKIFSLIGGLFVTPGTLPVYRREVFDKLGGFRSGHKGEDIEIAFRMQKNRFRIAQCHDVRVFTTVPFSLKALFKQRVRWTYAYINNVIDYRRTLFNKKYGNFAWFAVPSGVVSILTLLSLFGLLIYRGLKFFADEIIKIQTVGFDFTFQGFDFDWFFISTEAIIFLIILGYGLLLVSILIGNRLAEDKFSFSLKKTLQFFFIYSLFAPLWLFKAVFNTVFSRRTTWR